MRLLVSHDHQHLAGMQWLLMRLNADWAHSPSSEASPNSVASCKRPEGPFHCCDDGISFSNRLTLPEPCDPLVSRLPQ